jgi:hypothetical protein
MALSLGGTTLADATVYIPSEPSIGARHDLLNGNVAMDVIAQKRRWTVKWQGLTTAERDVILTKYRLKTSMTFVDYEGGSYTVIFGELCTYELMLCDPPLRWMVDIELLETA